MVSLLASCETSVIEFVSKNPELDILKHDFFSAERRVFAASRGLSVDRGHQPASEPQGELRARLMGYQRLLRILPDLKTAEGLWDLGITSASAIAAFSPEHFAHKAAHLFENGREGALAFHAKASDIKMRALHFTGAIKDLVASPGYAGRDFNSGASTLDFYRQLPSYTALFGNMDYFETDPGQTIFSPAAYFFDIMRIVDEYITAPNQAEKNIRAGYTLEERRPDLFSLKLTPENSSTELPYLHIVNEVLASQVSARSKNSDAWQTVALASYPFNLPFIRPLAGLREALSEAGLPLHRLYRILALDVPTRVGGPVTRDDALREKAGLSVSDVSRLRNTSISWTKVDAAYGYDSNPGGVQTFLPASCTGTITFQKGSTQARGKGTSFLKELSPGDQVQAGNITRTVVTISDETLTLDATAPADVSDATFTRLHRSGLDLADVFFDRTGLDQHSLDDLLTQGLSPAERSAGGAMSLYINAKGGDKPITLVKTDDPPNPVQRLQNIADPARLDRVNRFVRLAKLCGLAFSELQWIMESVGATDITEKLISDLGRIADLRAERKWELLDITAWYYKLKSWGKGNGSIPADQFDVIFNDPSLLHGQDPYTEGSDVPFNPFLPSPVMWTVEGADERSTGIRTRLRTALLLKDEDLTRITRYTLCLAGLPDAPALALNLENLSWLYRLSWLARTLGVAVEEALVFLSLYYRPKGKEPLRPEKDTVPLGLDTFADLASMMAFVTNCAFGIADMRYIITGNGGPNYSPRYNTAGLGDFLTELTAASGSSHLSPAALAGLFPDQGQCQALFDGLIQSGLINAAGVFLQDSLVYKNAAALLPVRTDSDGTVLGFDARSFASEQSGITEAESEAVLTILQQIQPPVLVPTVPGRAMVAEAITSQISLDCLKDIFIQKTDAKIAAVRDILMNACFGADQLLSLLSVSLNQQQSQVFSSLASYLTEREEILVALRPFASSASGLENWLAAFLSPGATKPPDAKTAAFVAVLDRWSLLAEVLHLEYTEVAYLSSPAGAAHFGVTDLFNLTLEDIRNIAGYAEFKQVQAVHPDRLLAWFEARTEERGAVLAEATGWAEKDIITFGAYFEQSPTVKAGTVAELFHLAAALGACRTLGTDAANLLFLSSTSHATVESGEKIDATVWDTLESQAQAALGILHARHAGTARGTSDTACTRTVNEASRDAILGYALWRINAALPEIQTPNDLYAYLLLDVEMGPCFMTSLVAQGIATVQLYLQRCRMRQEPGILLLNVPKAWWKWMMSYRVWEANRKIFLYPENYLEPTLRRSITPEFKEFAEGIMQNDPTKANIAKPFESYITSVAVLGELSPVGAYQARRVDPVTGEEKLTLFLIGKTTTEPHTFYYRTLENTTGWGPWRKVPLPIPSTVVTPVYAFSRLFLFWNEFAPIQSTVVKDMASATQTVDKVSLKYAFHVNDTWSSAQTLRSEEVINAYPAIYPPIQGSLSEAMSHENAFWMRPGLFSTGPGYTGAGFISVSKDGKSVSGISTRFKKEIRAGDTLVCCGWKLIVDTIASDTSITLRAACPGEIKSAGYKIVPGGNEATPSVFKGSGTVTIQTGSATVAGTGTRFLSEITHGDALQIGNERQLIQRVGMDNMLITAEGWKETAQKVEYYIIPAPKNDERIIVTLGPTLKTDGNLDPGDKVSLPNPNKDSFIAAQNRVSESVYNGLVLLRAYKGTRAHYVPLSDAYLLDADLSLSSAKILLADYKDSAEGNPAPFRGELRRNLSRLDALQSDNLFWDANWSANIPGFKDSYRQCPTASLPLLDNINAADASCIPVGNTTGSFLFDNVDEAFLLRPKTFKDIFLQSDGMLMTSRPLAPDLLGSRYLATGAYTTGSTELKKVCFLCERFGTSLMPKLQQRLFAGGMDLLLSLDSQLLCEKPFSRFYPLDRVCPANLTPPTSDSMDFDGAFGLYFWEIFFHGPFLVADRLQANAKYEDAIAWLEYVFNPTQSADDHDVQSSPTRFWRFLPFRKMDQPSLLAILQDERQISRYNFDPFDPDAIASIRHVAYAKSIVMRYVTVLLDWADSLFSQYTTESINQATNLYLYAENLLGKRPLSRGKLPPPNPKSYKEIKAEYPNKALPQFLIDLENDVDWSADHDELRYDSQPINDIVTYFAVPENKKFMALWDRIDDRLYKIRHCMNMDGQYIPLSLFDPPLDPKLIAQAASANSSSALTDVLAQPVPYYRFSHLVLKAQTICSQLLSLSQSVLAALEKKDAEALNLLINRQESSLIALQTSIRQQEIEDAQTQEAALEQGLLSAKHRKSHYDALLAKPVSSKEQASMDSATAACIFNATAGVTKTAASIGYAVPQVGSPFAMTYGGQQLGASLNAASGVLDIGAIIASWKSQMLQITASYERRTEDWKFQSRLAAYDIEQLEQQKKTAALRKNIAVRNLQIHEENLRQNQEKASYLKKKFTNEELYQWMANRLAQLQFQTYTLAWQLAAMAQRAYQYEYNTDRNYLSFTPWDTPHKGMSAAENIMLSLSRMEAAALDCPRLLEIERNIALSEIDPVALMQLRDTGTCFFSFTEALFDYDYPGHYNRKIKSLSLSIPSVTGPYQSVKGLLTQSGNHVVLKPDASGFAAVQYLLGMENVPVPPEGGMRSNWSNTQKIAISRADNETGLFISNYGDAQYLPFEGTGAVSSWRLELPKSTNHFPLSSIADVIITLRYTAEDGGAAFRAKITGLEPLKKYNCAEYINCCSMHYTQWQTFLASYEPGRNVQSLSLPLSALTPPNVREAKVIAVYTRMDAAKPAAGAYVSLRLTPSLTAVLDLGKEHCDQMYVFNDHGQSPPDVEALCRQALEVSFDLQKTPAILKTSEGGLNPEALYNMELVFFCSGIAG